MEMEDLYIINDFVTAFVIEREVEFMDDEEKDEAINDATLSIAEILAGLLDLSVSGEDD